MHTQHGVFVGDDENIILLGRQVILIAAAAIVFMEVSNRYCPCTTTVVGE
jgi:hypothetical protein